METVPQTVCIRHTFTHKKARYQKLRWSYRGGAPSASPGSATADKWTNGPRQERSRVPGTKVPWNERSRERIVLGGEGLSVYSSRERMVQGTNGSGNECSRERIVLRTKVPGNEWSRKRKFHHGNECSRERIVLRTNIPAFVVMTVSVGFLLAVCGVRLLIRGWLTNVGESGDGPLQEPLPDVESSVMWSWSSVARRYSWQPLQFRSTNSWWDSAR